MASSFERLTIPMCYKYLLLPVVIIFSAEYLWLVENYWLIVIIVTVSHADGDLFVVTTG